MNILSGVIHIFRFFNTYNDERNINYIDLMEKGQYFDSNDYKDDGYVEIKNVKKTTEFISIKI